MSLFARFRSAGCVSMGCVGLALASVATAAAPAAPGPLAGEPASGRFTFVAYGDTRSDAKAHEKIIQEIVKLHPEFVLQSGDLVDRGKSAEQWAEFDAITKPLR